MKAPSFIFSLLAALIRLDGVSAWQPALRHASSPGPSARRSPHASMLVDFTTALPDIGTLLAVELPPEFADVVQTSAKPTFGSYMMNAIGIYTILNAVCILGPRAKKIAAGEDPDALDERALMRVPVSTFGWHNVDLRTPLPAAAEELREHPIGVKDNRAAILVAESHLLASSAKYDLVEFSDVFSEHYGERVYVCYV